MSVSPGRGEATVRERSGVDAELISLGRRALDVMEGALEESPSELKQDIDVAERAIAELRDGLILALRADPDGPAAKRRRQVLDAANVSLSLVAGVEYPSGGIQRRMLEQACDVLRRVCADDAAP
ncbi:MAG: hypothetical protein AB7P40_20315 [Chloroflexota bacterium]